MSKATPKMKANETSYTKTFKLLMVGGWSMTWGRAVMPKSFDVAVGGRGCFPAPHTFARSILSRHLGSNQFDS